MRFVTFLCLFSALLGKYETIIIIEDNPFERDKVINSVLELFPKDVVLEFHGSGINDFLSYDFRKKRIAYISNFNRYSNKKLVKLLSGDARTLIHRNDNNELILPRISILASTGKTPIDKILKSNTFFLKIPDYDHNLEYYNKNYEGLEPFYGLEELEKKRIHNFINSVNKNYLVEIPYITVLKESFRPELLRSESPILRIFLELLQNITLLNSSKRNCYEIKKFGIKVLLAHPQDLMILVTLGLEVFKKLFRIQINYEEHENYFVELYNRRISMLKKDFDIEFYPHTGNFENKL